MSSRKILTFAQHAKRWKLDKYEREILAAYERGEYRPVPNMKQEMKRFQRMAIEQGKAGRKAVVSGATPKPRTRQSR